MIQTLKQREKDNENLFSKADDDFTQSIGNLKQLIQYYEYRIENDDVEFIVKGCYQLDSEVEKLLPTVHVPCEGPAKLRFDQNEEVIEKLFGKLENESDISSDFLGDIDSGESLSEPESPRPPTMLALTRQRNSAFRFKRGKTRGLSKRRSQVKVCLSSDIRSPSRISLENDRIAIKSVVSVDSEIAWINGEDKNNGTNTVQLMEKDGGLGLPIELEFCVGDMTLGFDDNLLLSQDRGSKIYPIENNIVEIWADLCPMYVHGLCRLKSSHIAVSVSERLDYSPNQRSTRAVLIINDNKHRFW